MLRKSHLDENSYTPQRGWFMVTESECSSRQDIKSEKQDSGQHTKRWPFVQVNGFVYVFVTQENMVLPLV